MLRSRSVVSLGGEQSQEQHSDSGSSSGDERDHSPNPIMSPSNNEMVAILNKMMEQNNQNMEKLSSKIEQNRSEFMAQLELNNQKITDLGSRLEQNKAELKAELSSQKEETSLELKDFKSEIKKELEQNSQTVKQTRDELSYMMSCLESRIFENVNIKLESLKANLDSQISDLKVGQEQLQVEVNCLKSDLTTQATVNQNKLNLMSTELKTEQSNLASMCTQNSNKIECIDQKLISIQSDVHHEISNKLANLSLLNPSNFISNNVGNNVRFHDVPKFSGKSQNPVAELHKIKRYINLNQKDFHSKGEWNTIANLLSICFTGSAQEWLQTILPEVDSWQTFEKYFMEVYFNSGKQMNLRINLLNGKYNAKNGKLNMVEYFQSKYSLAINTFPGLSQAEIIQLLSKHFHETIQNAVIVQNTDTYNKMISILQRFMDRESFSENSFENTNRNTTSFDSDRYHPSNQSRPNTNNFNSSFRNNRYGPYNNSNNFRPQSQQYNRNNNNTNNYNHNRFSSNGSNNSSNNYQRQNNSSFNRNRPAYNQTPNGRPNINRIEVTNESPEVSQETPHNTNENLN